ncbi:MAG: hypothetical protein VCE75_12370 [Alphaproteobacteria bacterium]
MADNHVVLIGHGTLRDPASAQAVRMHQRALAELDIFADVEVAFLDQPPRLDHVLAHHQDPLIGIGLFAGEGRHGANKMMEAFAASSGPSVYCGAIGRDPGLAALAVEHLKQARWPVDFNTQAYVSIMSVFEIVTSPNMNRAPAARVGPGGSAIAVRRRG